jgi:adenylylsulfate kinase
MINTRKRNIAKASTWKTLGFITLSALTYMITDSLKQMTYIAILYHLSMLIAYMLHERLWDKIRWGKTKGLAIQMTGMSGAGKSTLTKLVSKRLKKKGLLVEIIDGDEYRTNLCSDLGFSKEDRNTNIRRLGFVSKVLSRNNVITIIAAINPYDEIRKELIEKDKNLKTIYIKCKMDTLIDRDVKGLYKKALLPEGHPDKIYNFTGISDPFEAPNNPDLVINTAEQTVDKSVKLLEQFIMKEIS